MNFIHILLVIVLFCYYCVVLLLFVLFCFYICCAMYGLCVNVYYTTAKGCLPNCSRQIYQYLISCSNLMHHLFIMFITFLYMFRETMCSSSGGFIVYIQHLVLCVSLFLGDRSVHRQLEDSRV
jgi:hypothetical protein